MDFNALTHFVCLTCTSDGSIHSFRF